MKKLLFAMAALVLAQSSFAADPNAVDFSKIELTGMHLLDSDQQDAFGYKIKPVVSPDASVVQTLEEESNSKMVSPLYELNEKSAFKNIYVYVGKTEEGTFELVMAYENSPDSIFVVDMDLVSVEKDHMNLTHGPSDDQVSYTVVNDAGDLFPNGGL